MAETASTWCFEDRGLFAVTMWEACKSLTGALRAGGMGLVAPGRMAVHKRMAERTSELQRAVIDEYRRAAPADEVESDLWLDLLKTVRSVANNAGEADGAQSRQDFIQKFHICLKEGKECQQILTALIHTTPTRAIDLMRLQHSCNEIVAILVTSLKTAKANVRF